VVFEPSRREGERKEEGVAAAAKTAGAAGLGLAQAHNDTQVEFASGQRGGQLAGMALAFTIKG